MKASVAEKSADGAMVNRRFDASPDQNTSVVSRYPPYDGEPQQTTPGESHSLYSKMMVDSQTNLLYPNKKRQLPTTADQTSDITAER